KVCSGAPPSIFIKASCHGDLVSGRYPHAIVFPSGATDDCNTILSLRRTGSPPSIETFHSVKRFAPPITVYTTQRPSGENEGQSSPLSLVSWRALPPSLSVRHMCSVPVRS